MAFNYDTLYLFPHLSLSLITVMYLDNRYLEYPSTLVNVKRALLSLCGCIISTVEGFEGPDESVTQRVAGVNPMLGTHEGQAP